MQLTANFSLEELLRSEVGARNGWPNVPNAVELANLKRLASLLEMVRVTVGNRPVMITSGFRSKLINDAVGSKDSSQHRLGCAADFRVPGLTPRQVVQMCFEQKVPYDQIILEFGSWVHISVPNTPEAKPRNQALIIDRGGARPFV